MANALHDMQKVEHLQTNNYKEMAELRMKFTSMLMGGLTQTITLKSFHFPFGNVKQKLAKCLISGHKTKSMVTDRIVIRRGGGCRGCRGVPVVAICGDGGWDVVLHSAAVGGIAVVCWG